MTDETRLVSLLKRLKQWPQLLSEYNSIIRDQLDQKTVEVVTQLTLAVSDQVYYLSHHEGCSTGQGYLQALDSLRCLSLIHWALSQ